jgi:hypothetical protein
MDTDQIARRMRLLAGNLNGNFIEPMSCPDPSVRRSSTYGPTSYSLASRPVAPCLWPIRNEGEGAAGLRVRNKCQWSFSALN